MTVPEFRLPIELRFSLCDFHVRSFCFQFFTANPRESRQFPTVKYSWNLSAWDSAPIVLAYVCTSVSVGGWNTRAVRVLFCVFGCSYVVVSMFKYVMSLVCWRCWRVMRLRSASVRIFSAMVGRFSPVRVASVSCLGQHLFSSSA